MSDESSEEDVIQDVLAACEALEETVDDLRVTIREARRPLIQQTYDPAHIHGQLLDMTQHTHQIAGHTHTIRQAVKLLVYLHDQLLLDVDEQKRDRWAAYEEGRRDQLRYLMVGLDDDMLDLLVRVGDALASTSAENGQAALSQVLALIGPPGEG